MLGTYIDALPERSRARIVRWKTWCRDAIIDEDKRFRDLIGVAENWYGIRAHDWRAVEARRAVARRYRTCHHDICPQHPCVLDRMGGRWERLVDRVGMDRAVELVKRRAARGDPELVAKIEESLTDAKPLFSF